MLPLRAMMMDSGPGRVAIVPSVTAVRSGMGKTNWVMRGLVTGMLYVLMTVLKVVGVLTRRPNITTVLRAKLNDPALVDTKAARCYVYSEVDEMVGWEDVEDHAREARSLGYTVDLQKFEGSGHASHARVDEKRYWGLVQALCDRTIPAK